MSIIKQQKAFSENIIEQSNKILDEKKQIAYNKHQGCILYYLLTKNEKKESLKTANTNIYNQQVKDYKLNEIKRFDELNKSLSDISDFDLENEKKSDFSSSEDDQEFEEEEIFNKNKRKFSEKSFDIEYEKEVEKDCEGIIKQLHQLKICK